MGVTAHELVDDRRGDVGDREPAGLGRELGLEDDLQEEIAELVTERIGVAALDRLDDLVGFFDHVRPQALGTLLTVPRAPAGAPQPRHDLHEADEGIDRRAVSHRGTVSAALRPVNARVLARARGRV